MQPTVRRKVHKLVLVLAFCGALPSHDTNNRILPYTWKAEIEKDPKETRIFEAIQKTTERSVCRVGDDCVEMLGRLTSLTTACDAVLSVITRRHLRSADTATLVIHKTTTVLAIRDFLGLVSLQRQRLELAACRHPGFSTANC